MSTWHVSDTRDHASVSFKFVAGPYCSCLFRHSCWQRHCFPRDCDYHDTFSAVVCYDLCHHSLKTMFIRIRCWRHGAKEGQKAIESCVELECYEMRVEWIEVWTLFVVRYT